MRDFAQELVEKVIDHYAEPRDMASVKVCGLVCKRWSSRSRFHLFSRVILDKDNLSLFIDIIDSSSSPILSFIQHLTLRFAGRCLEDALLDKIHHCPNIRGIEACISVVNADEIDNFYQSLQIPFWANNAPSLSHFNFKCVDGHIMGVEPGKIFDMIKYIPSMEYLGISGVSILMWDDTSAVGHLLPPHWQALDIDVYLSDRFLSSLLLLPTVPSLKSLRLNLSTHLEDIPRIEKYFQYAGGEIESLSLSIVLGIMEHNEEPKVVNSFLRHTPKVRNLELWISPVVDVLSVLPSQEWDTITFVLYDHDCGICWGSIDLALSDARFSTLRRFIINRSAFDASTRTHSFTSRITTETKLLMPLANARGILA
ncbi:hypothetical protein B0H13DRAFT_1866698 [Mycena leptocephala]|nr:hypothetical protein B0H13DRAFT_1866698 [Mycena leptocephala]